MSTPPPAHNTTSGTTHSAALSTAHSPQPPVGEEAPPAAMTFSRAARTCLRRKYATFSGRGRRAEYWWFSLLYVAAVAVFAATSWLVGTWVIALASLAFVPPMLSASVRRLHDTGRSGWYMLLALVPVAGPLIYLGTMAIASQPHDNRYGPSPVAPARYVSTTGVLQ